MGKPVTRSATKSRNACACSGVTSRSGQARKLVRPKPVTWLNSNSASSRGESPPICSMALVKRASQVSEDSLIIGQFCQQFGLVFLLQGNHHGVEIAGNHLVQLIQGQVDPVVGYPALGKIVGSDTFRTVATTQDRKSTRLNSSHVR